MIDLHVATANDDWYLNAYGGMPVLQNSNQSDLPMLPMMNTPYYGGSVEHWFKPTRVWKPYDYGCADMFLRENAHHNPNWIITLQAWTIDHCPGTISIGHVTMSQQFVRKMHRISKPSINCLKSFCGQWASLRMLRIALAHTSKSGIDAYTGDISNLLKT
jgi:hypothetical protein